MKLQKERNPFGHKNDLLIKKHTFYSNKDYETMTMRHLPPDHWNESLKKIN